MYAGTFDGEEVAVKVFAVTAAQSQAIKAQFWKEVHLQYSLRHDNVVAVLGAAVDDSDPNELVELAIIQPRMKCSLSTWLYEGQGRMASLLERLRILRDITAGLRFLHAKNIVHADLKPANVLLDARDSARIADFGLATTRLEEEATRGSHIGERGTTVYMDVGLLAGTSSLRKASDVFSFGVLAWEVLTGTRPYEDVQPFRVQRHVEEGGRPDIARLPPDLPHALRSLLPSCWDASYSARPRMAEVHAVFVAALTSLHSVPSGESAGGAAGPTWTWGTGPQFPAGAAGAGAVPAAPPPSMPPPGTAPPPVRARAAGGNDSPQRKVSGLSVGIDLGATYCRVGTWSEDNGVEILVNEHGRRATPACITFQNCSGANIRYILLRFRGSERHEYEESFTGEELLVGEAAVANAAANRGSSVSSIISLLDAHPGDPWVQAACKRQRLQHMRGANGETLIELTNCRQERPYFSVPELCAILLLEMKRVAQAALGEEVKNAVITVPASFNMHQRASIHRAAVMAGLNVLRIISSTEAAGLCLATSLVSEPLEAQSDEDEENVVVVDLGGGSLSVSLLNLDSCGVVEEKATAGDAHLGGDDFTDV